MNKTTLAVRKHKLFSDKITDVKLKRTKLCGDWWVGISLLRITVGSWINSVAAGDVSYNLVNIGSGNGLVPSGTKPHLNQCWLIINEVLYPAFSWWPFHQQCWWCGHYGVFENYTFEITAPSPRGQWVHKLNQDHYWIMYLVNERLAATFNLSSVMTLAA